MKFALNWLWHHRLYWFPGCLLALGVIVAVLISSGDLGPVLFRYVF